MLSANRPRIGTIGNHQIQSSLIGCSIFCLNQMLSLRIVQKYFSWNNILKTDRIIPFPHRSLSGFPGSAMGALKIICLRGSYNIEKSDDITDKTKKLKEESAPCQHSLLFFHESLFSFYPLQLIPIPPKLSFSEREKRKLRGSGLQAALVVPLVDADNLIEPFKPFFLLLISHPHQVVHLL